MALLSDYKTKLHMAFDRQLPVEARAFAPTIMVNEVSAQHLGAIQVLDYLLGALAGALLLLARLTFQPPLSWPQTERKIDHAKNP